MNIREKLDKLRDSELKELLDKKNTIIKKGSIVLYKGILCEVLERAKGYCIMLTEKNVSATTGITSLEILTYDKYKEIRNKKYSDGDIFKNDVDKVIRFLNLILKKVYKDNYEITNFTNYNFQITIYYPEIKIRNSLDIEHTMLDVYLTLYFNLSEHGHIYLYDYSLFRGKYTLEEYYNRFYMFSHINSNGGYEVSSGGWCLGTTEFAAYVRMCREQISPTDILFLISQFHAYLQWESIEGVPYRFLVGLKSYLKREIISPAVSSRFFKEATNKVLSKIEWFTYDFRLTSESCDIKLSPESINRISNILSELYPEYCVTLIDNNPVQIKPLTFPDIKDFNPKECTKTFKGDEISIQLIDTGKSEEVVKSMLENSTKGVFPHITENVVSRLESMFSEYFTNKKLNSL